MLTVIIFAALWLTVGLLITGLLLARDLPRLRTTDREDRRPLWQIILIVLQAPFTMPAVVFYVGFKEVMH